LKRPNFPGDYKTPEQRIPDPSELEGFDWEACMTMGSSWGYKSWDTEWKTTEALVRNLLRITSMGGNYQLNVGPTPLGEIPQESIDGLQAIGRWMKVNGEAVYGTRRSPVDKPAWGYITRKDGKKTTTLYLSVCEWPAGGKIILEGLADAKSAILLSGKTKLKTAKTAKGFEIQLPGQMPDPIATVVKLELKGKLASTKGGAGQSKGFDIVDE
jgi:alpha-L-fucosidase